MARKTTFVMLAVVALLLLQFTDCVSAMTQDEQSMQCCNSMPCSSHGHDAQDCCKTMPAMRAPFVQPSSVHGVSYSPVVFAVLPAVSESHGIESSDRVIVAQSHAPPILGTLAPLPLRI